MPTILYGVTPATLRPKPWQVDEEGRVVTSGGLSFGGSTVTGTAGTSATGVLTVQGIAGETPVMITNRETSTNVLQSQVVLAAGVSNTLSVAASSRTRYSIYNPTAGILYVRKAAAAASATSFDFIVGPGESYQSDLNEWAGEIRAFSVGGGMIMFSQKVSFGPEIITNGGFDSDTAWTKETAAWTITGGLAVATAVPFGISLYQTFVVTAGKTYWIEFDVVSISGSVIVICGNTQSSAFSTVGRKTMQLTAQLSSHINLMSGISNTTGTFDNITAREVL